MTYAGFIYKVGDGEFVVVENENDTEGYCKYCLKAGLDTYFVFPKRACDYDL